MGSRAGSVPRGMWAHPRLVTQPTRGRHPPTHTLIEGHSWGSAQYPQQTSSATHETQKASKGHGAAPRTPDPQQALSCWVSAAHPK